MARWTEADVAKLGGKVAKRKPKKRGPSELEETFKVQLRMMGQEGWEEEFQFHPTRKWRFDFAHPAYKIAVECEGGVHSQGRHTRGSGFEKDCEKYNAAAILGWCVLRYTKRMLDEGVAMQDILSLWTERG
jgi:very-short-patch-repair endonuclease